MESLTTRPGIRGQNLPTGDIERTGLPKENTALMRLINSNLTVAHQAAINAGFDFRRYAMKPSPAKPSFISAQVVGSGTAVIDKSRSASETNGPSGLDWL